MKKHKKALSMFLAVCFIVTLFPLNALAAVPGKDMGTIVKGDEPTFNRSRYRLFHYWDVVDKASGEKLGESAACQEYDHNDDNRTPVGWKNLVDTGTLEAWVEAFNGNIDFVKGEVANGKIRTYELLEDKEPNKPYWRYWIRDIANASGASVEPDAGRQQVIAQISNPPAAEISVPDKLSAGVNTEIGIYAESWVLYRQEGGYPGITWELQVDGDTVKEGSVKTMATEKFAKIPYTFCCEGEYTLTLIATDGVGRQSIDEVTVTVGEGEIPVEKPVVPQGDPNLKLTAVDQPRTETRPENTAKWTDWVTANFTAPSAPDLGDCYSLKKWELQKAEIVYPKKHKDFTFGHPLPPEGTVTKAMAVNKKNNTATIEFQEDWSMNGAFVYDIFTKKMIPGPTLYPVSVKYEILWEYRKGVKRCDEDGCWCENWKDYKKTETGTATVQLLVNGTGVDSRAQ